MTRRCLLSSTTVTTAGTTMMIDMKGLSKALKEPLENIKSIEAEVSELSFSTY
jgi:hypothetical protein